ncbi:MAG: LacI family DNA-binding transcriptional regulator [Clostridia bacterium]
MSQERHKRLTLKDIAAKTGYSVITISKALRDGSDLADSTKKLIQETAQSMGYVANSAANALRSGQTKTIALTLVDISNPFWGCYAKKVDTIARSHGYTTMIMNTDMDGKREEFAIRTAVERGVDGLIIDPSVSYRSNVRILEKFGIPFVIAGYIPNDISMDTVSFDEYQIAYLTAKRFLEKGRTELLMLNLPKGLPCTAIRAQGFLDALQEAGLGPEHVSIANVDNIEGECVRVLRRLMEERPAANGVFAYGDHRALEVADELASLGLRIPEDVALIGSGTLKSYLRIPFSLTTTYSPPTLIAHEGTELLIRRMQGDMDPPSLHVKIPVHIVEGKSC